MAHDAAADHEAWQARIDRKVADWERRPRSGSPGQRARGQIVLNALRGSNAVVHSNQAVLDDAGESKKSPPKLTPRQREVMANLASVTTDGSRHDPQFRLDGKNVCVQVRSLLMHGRIALEQGRLVKAEVRTAPVSRAVDSKAVVSAMRELLCVATPRNDRV